MPPVVRAMVYSPAEQQQRRGCVTPWAKLSILQEATWSFVPPGQHHEAIVLRERANGEAGDPKTEVLVGPSEQEVSLERVHVPCRRERVQEDALQSSPS